MSASGFKVLMVLDDPFPPDPRVSMEAESLKEAGHDITLVCLTNKGSGQPQNEQFAFGSVVRIPISRLMHKMSALAYTFPVYHLWLSGVLKPILLRQKPRVVHVHDIRSGQAVLKVLRRWLPGAKLVLDLHENRPEIMKHYRHVRSISGRLIIFPSLWKKAETRLVNFADAVITVTPEAAEDLKKNPEITQRNFITLSNTVSRDYATNGRDTGRAEALMTGRDCIVYVGDTGLRRGLETAITALGLLTDAFPKLHLIIVGQSSDDRTLQILTHKLGLEGRVHFEGWQPADTFQSYLLRARVGISPLRRNAHHDTTFANKIFQYMACGLPQAVSDCIAQARIVSEFGCGLVHAAGDAKSLSDALRSILSDKILSECMGKAGKDAIANVLCRDMQSHNLTELYARLRQSSADSASNEPTC